MMNNNGKKLLLYILNICLLGTLGVVLFYMSKEGGNNYEILLMVVALSIVIVIALIVFYLKFRLDTSAYEFNTMQYRKDRADFEEKIRELQKAINNNYVAWKDNNHLALSGLNNDWVNMSAILDSQFGVRNNQTVAVNSAFMLMPFNKDAFKAYKQCNLTAKKLGITLQKSDDEIIEGDILKYVVKKIVAAEIIIANLDGKNPNVFYELGIAHTLGKKTILITSYKPEEMPFDIKNKYIIFYQTMGELDRKMCSALTAMLEMSSVNNKK